MRQRITIDYKHDLPSLYQAIVTKNAFVHSPDMDVEFNAITSESASRSSPEGRRENVSLCFLSEVLEQYHQDDSSIVFLEKGSMHHILLFKKDVGFESKTAITIGTVDPMVPDTGQAFLSRAFPQTDDRNVSIQLVALNQTFEATHDTKDQVLNYLNDLATPSFEQILELLKRQLQEQIQDIFHSSNLDALILPPRFTTLLDASSFGQLFNWMILPLFEFPPLTGSSYTVFAFSEAVPGLRKLDNQTLRAHFEQENMLVHKMQSTSPVGVFHLRLPQTSFTYAAAGKQTSWNFDLSISTPDKIFSGTDYMKGFFNYQNFEQSYDLENFDLIFIASHKAVNSEKLRQQLHSKRVWAAGGRTWTELAKFGLWVEGSADALGLEYAMQVIESAPIPVLKDRICILTNKSASEHWQRDGWNAIGTYELIASKTEAIDQQIREADMLFWTSFQQYEICRALVKPGAIHASAAGKTATLLKEQGIQPVVFPTIKAFEYWRRKQEK